LSISGGSIPSFISSLAEPAKSVRWFLFSGGAFFIRQPSANHDFFGSNHPLPGGERKKRALAFCFRRSQVDQPSSQQSYNHPQPMLLRHNPSKRTIVGREISEEILPTILPTILQPSPTNAAPSIGHNPSRQTILGPEISKETLPSKPSLIQILTRLRI